MMCKTMVFFLIVGLLIFPGCSTSGEADSEYTLTVILGEGVNGTPASGVYTHAGDDVVTYGYSAQQGYGNVAVTLDGSPIASSGAITVSGNHTLNATADIDLRGEWIGRFIAGWDSYFRLTFSGGTLSGSVSAHIDAVAGTGNGTFAVTDSQIEFNLNYQWGILGFTGTIESVNRMSGTWQIVSDNDKKLPSSGSWELER